MEILMQIVFRGGAFIGVFRRLGQFSTFWVAQVNPIQGGLVVLELLA